MLSKCKYCTQDYFYKLLPSLMFSHDCKLCFKKKCTIKCVLYKDEIVWRMCASCFMALLRRPCWEENSAQSEKMYAWAHTRTHAAAPRCERCRWYVAVVPVDYGSCISVNVDAGFVCMCGHVNYTLSMICDHNFWDLITFLLQKTAQNRTFT